MARTKATEKWQMNKEDWFYNHHFGRWQLRIPVVYHSEEEQLNQWQLQVWMGAQYGQDVSEAYHRARSRSRSRSRSSPRRHRSRSRNLSRNCPHCGRSRSRQGEAVVRPTGEITTETEKKSDSDEDGRARALYRDLVGSLLYISRDGTTMALEHQEATHRDREQQITD